MNKKVFTTTKDVKELTLPIYGVYYYEKQDGIKKHRIHFLITEETEEYIDGELIDKHSCTKFANWDITGYIDVENCENCLGFTNNIEEFYDWKDEITYYKNRKRVIPKNEI